MTDAVVPLPADAMADAHDARRRAAQRVALHDHPRGRVHGIREGLSALCLMAVCERSFWCFGELSAAPLSLCDTVWLPTVGATYTVTCTLFN